MTNVISRTLKGKKLFRVGNLKVEAKSYMDAVNIIKSIWDKHDRTNDIYDSFHDWIYSKYLDHVIYS